MTVLTHKTFLQWLLYLMVVIFGISSLTYLGLPQIALHYDRSDLTLLLFAMYCTAEILAGRQAWWVSQENRIADQGIAWLTQHPLWQIVVHDDTIQLCGPESMTLPDSMLAEHFILCGKAHGKKHQFDQSLMIDILAERAYSRALIGDFIAARIVWVGILATIVGVIMAFWPMIDGISIDMMRANLGRFFGGIAVAFIPTAVSFICKIVLDCNTRIISAGVRDLIEKIAGITATKILPALDCR
jgi:hypothetical protein